MSEDSRLYLRRAPGTCCPDEGSKDCCKVKRVRRVSFSDEEFLVLRSIVERTWEHSIGDDRGDHGLKRLSECREWNAELKETLGRLCSRLNGKRLR